MDLFSVLLVAILFSIIGHFHGLWYSQKLKTDRKFIEFGILEHLKKDEVMSFYELYFLLKLKPIDVETLVDILKKLEEKETVGVSKSVGVAREKYYHLRTKKIV